MFLIAPCHQRQYPVTRGEFAAFIKDSGYEPAQSCWVEVRAGKYDFKDGAGWGESGLCADRFDPVVCVRGTMLNIMRSGWPRRPADPSPAGPNLNSIRHTPGPPPAAFGATRSR